MKNCISYYRKKAGLSQADVSKKLNLSSNSTVSQWETGSRKPNVELLPKLAQILGCTVDELLRDDKEVGWGMNEKLKARMDRKGISRRELAKRIGVHKVSLSRKMCGKREWSWSEVLLICNVLGIENPIGYFDIKVQSRASPTAATVEKAQL